MFNAKPTLTVISRRYTDVKADSTYGIKGGCKKYMGCSFHQKHFFKTHRDTERETERERERERERGERGERERESEFVRDREREKRTEVERVGGREG